MTPTGSMVVLRPDAGGPAAPAREAKRLDSLRGQRVAYLANGKLMADVFLEETARILRLRFDHEAIFVTKPDMSRVASEALLDRLAAQCHAIITGVGD